MLLTEAAHVQAALTKALKQVRSINELESETERLRMAQQCVVLPAQRTKLFLFAGCC